ncbi:hypothetical protein HMPREF1320_0546 [Capnocytophaga sp. oral taxon 335 str. F0486]|nr:hypothetical protein HMPREF1320_0546 [Capnocytophaga sp. oral taxon 335 str. F0486]
MIRNTRFTLWIVFLKIKKYRENTFIITITYNPIQKTYKEHFSFLKKISHYVERDYFYSLKGYNKHSFLKSY